MNTYRLLFLGAGFSHLAGLPLGPSLFREVRRKVRAEYGADNHVERDLKRFTEYTQQCFGRVVATENVDCEEFLGFLDVEHYLGLKGKDTWSSEGNESQLMIRRAIGQVISSMTPSGSAVPDAYRRFAAQLNTTDWIYTFNYDTLLEHVLELEGIPYRLFPQRYSKVNPLSCTIDADAPDELVIAKLHGSIDWFSRRGFDESNQQAKEAPHFYPKNYQVRHPLFGYDAVVTPKPLTEGPRPANDSLSMLYRVKDVGRALAQSFWECTPFILSPSTTKLFYAEPLMELWRGLQRAGGLNLSLGFIGYSLPAYDDYAMQAIYHVARNYQYVEPDFELDGRRKTKVRIIDFQPNEEAAQRFRDRYRFLDWSRTEACFTGFDSSAVDWFLS
jgi:hypothetical protein